MSENKPVQSAPTRIGEILISIVAVMWCFTIIGMIWGIPMLRGNKQRKEGTKAITVGHVVISFLFYGWIGSLLVALVGNVKTS